MSEELVDSVVLISVSGALVVLLALVFWKWRTDSLALRKRQAELWRVQAELQENQRQWESVKEEKMKLLSLLSHDLKGPFNRIFALVQLLNFSSTNLTPEQKEYIARVHQMATEGLAMIRNLLDTRNIETRSIEFKPENIGLKDLLTTVVSSLKPLAEKKSIVLSVDLQENCSVIADREIVQRIVENLVSNAVKFSPIPSTVKVGCVWINGQVEIRVTDQGPGLTQEDQPRLFKKFQTLSTKPTGGESSTGLGLSVTKAMTEKMGGQVHYEPGPEGKGSCFVVTFPA